MTMNEEYEDDEIIIKEHSDRRPEAEPYDPVRLMDGDDDESQTQTMDQSSYVPIMTRRERWLREQENNMECPSSQSSSEESSRENDFASFEALLESQETETNKADPSKTAPQDTGGNAAMTTAHAQSSTTVENHREQSTRNVELKSVAMPPSRQDDESTYYAMGVDDQNEDLKDPMAPQGPKESSPLLKRGKRIPRTVTTSVGSIDLAGANSLLKKSRRAAMKHAKKASLDRTRQVQKKSTSSSTAVAKSIVGSRPTHWGSSSLRPLSNAHRLQRKRKPDLVAALSRATKARTLIQKRSSTSITQSPQKPAPTNRKDTSDKESDPIREEQAGGTMVLSFAPSFVAPSTSPPRESSEPVEGQDAFPNPLFSSPEPTSPAFRKPKRRSKAGPLSKRLEVIRDAVKGDMVRFQSGQYPFSKSSLDMNDPRNRAKSYMDVTILGDASTGFDRQHHKLFVLGFIHALVKGLVDESDHAQKQLAWICLDQETAREQKIAMGSQLRIYNGVVVPLSADTAESTRNGVKWVVLCTTLCETYPTSLPKLPDVQSLLSGVHHE